MHCWVVSSAIYYYKDHKRSQILHTGLLKAQCFLHLHTDGHGKFWVVFFFFMISMFNDQRSQGAQGQPDQLQQRRQHGGCGLRRRRIVLAEPQPAVVGHVQQPEPLPAPGEGHAQSQAPQRRWATHENTQTHTPPSSRLRQRTKPRSLVSLANTVFLLRLCAPAARREYRSRSVQPQSQRPPVTSQSGPILDSGSTHGLVQRLSNSQLSFNTSIASIFSQVGILTRTGVTRQFSCAIFGDLGEETATLGGNIWDCMCIYIYLYYNNALAHLSVLF